MRSLSEIGLRALKAATAASYDLAGGVSLLSQLLRMSVATVSKYASFNPDHSENFIRIDLAVEADRRAGSPVIVSAMARELGFRLEPLQDAARSSNPLSEADAMRIMDEAADIWRTARAAWADGRLDAAERRELGQKLRQLMRACECVLSRLEGGEA